jgi:hypothetical protein
MRFCAFLIRASCASMLFSIVCYCCPEASAQTTFKSICPQAGILVGESSIPSIYSTTIPGRKMDKGWERNSYPILIFDVGAVNNWLELQRKADAAPIQADKKSFQDQANQASIVYWYEPVKNPKGYIYPLAKSTIVSKVFTTENVAVLLCNARVNDKFSVGTSSYVPNDAATQDDVSKQARIANIVALIDESDGVEVDRLYFIDPAKGNDVLSIHLMNDQTPLTNIAVERHRVVRFSAGGGLLATRATANTFGLQQYQNTTTTTTMVNSTTSVGGVTTSSTNSSTPSSASASANYISMTKGSSVQFNSVVGLTWYPFGNDTFTVVRGHWLTIDYAHMNPVKPIGLFVGTSANTLGNFTVAPSYEITPGVQIFAGATWWNKVTLQPNLTSCSGIGTSPAFSTSPTATTTESSDTNDNGVHTITLKTTTISSSTISTCANGDKASIITASSAPTQSSLKPAFSFGVLFNTNLIKAFGTLFAKQ